MLHTVDAHVATSCFMPHPSPVIFWLLVAATLSVDVVALTWSYAVSLQHAEELYIALVCSQLSVACVWAFLSTSRQLRRLLVPFVFALAAALWAGWVRQFERSGGGSPMEVGAAYFGLWTTQAVLLLAILWFLRRTSYGRNLQGTTINDRWRFSVKELLIVTTAVALLIVILKSARLIHEAWLFVLIWTVGNVGLSIAAVVIHTTSWHVVMRLAAMATVAGLLGFVIEVFGAIGEVVVINLIQAIVLFLWLEFGDIIPMRGDVNDADSAISPTIPEPSKSA